MPSEELNGLIAILGGLLIAVAAFVPAAAVHYRRHGRFTFVDLVALVAVPIYGLALWTYTLLPLPDGDWVCTTAQLDPAAFVDDLRRVWTGSLTALVRNPVFLQLALNVALFVPLGVILRLRYRRGLLWAFGLGLGISLLIETTQLTGIWGLYDCSYRFFDVDDLFMNTTGAVLGSLLSKPIGRHLAARRHEEPLPAGPTFGRRVVAMLCDVLSMVFIGAGAVVAWRLWELEVNHIPVAELDAALLVRVQWITAVAAQAAVTLTTGASIGELVVNLRTVASRRWWTLPARSLKLCVGSGTFGLLMAWESAVAGFVLVVWGLATVAVAAFSPDHRGLANLVAGLRVEVRGAPRLDAGPSGASRFADERSARSDP